MSDSGCDAIANELKGAVCWFRFLPIRAAFDIFQSVRDHLFCEPLNACSNLANGNRRSSFEKP
jgi:hypothetical protein